MDIKIFSFSRSFWHYTGGHSISFQTFFVWAFKIVVDFGKFTMLLLYILWDDWPIFMISASNEQLQQQLEYALLKPDCHSWWISKMQSDTLEEWYAIKFSLIGIILRWGFLIWELIFIYCGLFVLILVVFSVVSSFTTFRPNFTSGLLQVIFTVTSDRNDESYNRIPSNYCLP